VRPLVPLLALLAVAGTVAGLSLEPPAAVLLGAVVGTAAGMLLVRWGNKRIEALWTQLRAGLSDPPAHDPSDIGWRRLGAAVDQLLAEHQSTLARQQESPLALEVVGSLIEPALLFDEDDVLVAANVAAKDLLGISELGIRSNQALGSSAFAGAVTEARGLRRPVHVDAEVSGMELSAVVTMVEDLALVIVSDRTRERQVEALRRDFVVNASHELKTPVTSIVTLAEALQVVVSRPGNEERAGDLVRRLGEEAERMSTLVHDLLDLRRLEERGPVEVVPVDVADAARAVVADLRENAEDVQVTVSVEANGTAVIAAELDDVHIMLRNLVLNAIQYNRPGGSVRVIVQPSGSHVEVRVNDTGIGLSQQDIPRIFERFYRVDTARSRDAGGTGLGLSLVRHAVERHGGTVQVDSLLGEGSTFTVVLPVSPS
jgi:signal transduction histidine kinase